jgi:hypothetical protein
LFFPGRRLIVPGRHVEHEVVAAVGDLEIRGCRAVQAFGFHLGTPRQVAVAADVAFYAVVGAIALTVLRVGANEFIDVVLIATLLGFLAPVALGALVGRGTE